MEAELLCCGGCNALVICPQGTEPYCCNCHTKLKRAKAPKKGDLSKGRGYDLSLIWDSALDMDRIGELRSGLSSGDYAKCADIIRDYESDMDPRDTDPDVAAAILEHIAGMILDGELDGRSLDPLFEAMRSPFAVIAMYGSTVPASWDVLDEDSRGCVAESLWDVCFSAIRSEPNMLMGVSAFGSLSDQLPGLEGFPEDLCHRLVGFGRMLSEGAIGALIHNGADPYTLIPFWSGNRDLAPLLESAWEAFGDGDRERAVGLLREYVLRYVSMDGDWENCDDGGMFDELEEEGFFLRDKCTGEPGASSDEIKARYGDRDWWSELDSAFTPEAYAAEIADTVERILDENPDDEEDIRICICSRTVDWLYGNILEGRVCRDIDPLVSEFPRLDFPEYTDNFMDYTTLLSGTGHPLRFVQDADALEAAIDTITSMISEAMFDTYYPYEMRDLMALAGIAMELVRRAAESLRADDGEKARLAGIAECVGLALTSTATEIGRTIDVEDIPMMDAVGDGALDDGSDVPVMIAGEFDRMVAMVMRSGGDREEADRFTDTVMDMLEDYVDRYGYDSDDLESIEPMGTCILGPYKIDQIGVGEPVERFRGLYFYECPECRNEIPVDVGSTVSRCIRCGREFTITDSDRERLVSVRPESDRNLAKARGLLSRGNLMESEAVVNEVLSEDGMYWRGWLLAGRIKTAGLDVNGATIDWSTAMDDLALYGQEEFDEFYSSVLDSVHDAVFGEAVLRGGDVSRISLPDLAASLDLNFPEWSKGRHLMTDLLDLLEKDVDRCRTPEALFYLASEYGLTVVNCHFEFSDIRKHMELCDRMLDLEPRILARLRKLRGSPEVKRMASDRLSMLMDMYSSMRSVMAEGISSKDAGELDDLTSRWSDNGYHMLGDVVMHAVEAYMSCMHSGRVDTDSGGKLMRRYVRMYLDGPDAE